MPLYQPPPPNPFIGGCQPLAPGNNPPSTLLVDTPPKLWDGWQLNAVRLWDPPPPDAFIGGHQPLAPRFLTASLETVPNPPFSHWQRTKPYLEVSRLWDPPDPQPFIGARQPLAPRVGPPSTLLVDTPPELWDGWQLNAVRLWDPPDPQPFIGMRQPLAPRVGPPSTLLVDTPPKYRINLTSTFISWLPPQPAQVFDLKLVLGGDNPPFGWPPSWMNLILVSWLPPPPTPQRSIPKQILSVDNPPIGYPLEWLNSVLTQWQPGPPQPQRQNPIQIVSVDNPPRLSREIQNRIIGLWELPAQPGQLIVPATIAPLTPDNPPFGTVIASSTLYNIIEQWQPTIEIVRRAPVILVPGGGISGAGTRRILVNMGDFLFFRNG